MTIDEILTKINDSGSDSIFAGLYGEDQDVISRQRVRYSKAVEAFSVLFPEDKEGISIFSAPGRTEICGNHTDHQRGRVLAAAVDLDTIAVVSFRKEHVIRICSEGYPHIEVNIDALSAVPEEKGTTAALVRGMVSRFTDLGINVSGFDAYITSSVLSGSGLSSSAAFEMLIGKIIDCHDNHGGTGAAEIAKFGQYAENVYFGKACGLMDQMVSSVGGFVEIDFADADSSKIDVHQCDLDKLGFSLIITDTKGSHADLSDEYSAIPEEMRSVARFFGKDVLREVDENEFFSRISELKKDSQINDRAILRSAHFFSENARVKRAASALDKGNIRGFLDQVNASGESSERLLQNLFCTSRPKAQEIPLALMLSRKILGEEGACRVHGGGFAGTIQAFVPKTKEAEYVRTLESVYGQGSCHILHIRPCGSIKVF